MAKLLIEYEGTYDLKESVCENKIMSGKNFSTGFRGFCYIWFNT